MGFLVDADGQETLKRRTLLVKHADRCVARVRELARRIQHALKNSLEVEFGDERATGFDEQFEAAFALSGNRMQAVHLHRCSLRGAPEAHNEPSMSTASGSSSRSPSASA